MDIFPVYPKMTRQLLDVLRQYSYLDFSGSGVLVIDAVFPNDVGFSLAV